MKSNRTKGKTAPRKSLKPRLRVDAKTKPKAKVKSKTAAKRKATLKSLQTWFGKTISKPLPNEYPQHHPLAVSSPNLKAEADTLLREKGGLSGFARISIYNQQYWFRLITIMQSEYPCAVHVLGLRKFNDWAIRFLDAHPPSSPYLARLDAEFSAFLAARYKGAGKAAVLQAVAYDHAFSIAFDAHEGTPLQAPEPGGAAGAVPFDLMAVRLTLPPHATVLKVDYDFPAYRVLCVQDESLEARIHPRPDPSCLVIYRDADLNLQQKKIPHAAYLILREFATPKKIPEIFEKLEGRLSEEDRTETEKNLSGWFQDWVARGWLTRPVKRSA